MSLEPKFKRIFVRRVGRLEGISFPLWGSRWRRRREFSRPQLAALLCNNFGGPVSLG